MKPRATTWLLLVVFLVGGLVYWDYHRGVTTEDAAARRRKILEIDPAAITRLELVRSNETIVVEKSGEEWRIRQPLEVRADFSAVRSILDELEFAERKRTLAEDELGYVSQPDLGLAVPRLKLTLSGSGLSATVSLGHPTPTGEAVYLRINDEPGVVIADRGIGRRLDKTLDQLRDRAVFDFSPTTAARLQIKTSERLIELARQDGRWVLLQPLAARASQTKLAELLGNLAAIRVEDFVSEDPKEIMTYRLNEPVKEVTLWQENQTEGLTLLIAGHPTNDTSQVYATCKGRNSIFTIARASLDQLDLQPNDLRDPNVFAFEMEAVRDVRLLRGAEEIALVRTNGAWEISSPLRTMADEEGMRRFLGALRDLQVEEFVADVASDLEKYGLAVPSLIVTFADDQGESLAQLLVGTASTVDQPLRYVKLTAEPFVYGVDPTAIDRWPATAWALRHRDVWELEAASINRFAIETGSQRVVVERGADNGQWTLVEPAQGVVDSDRLRQLIAAFARLRAEEVLPPAAEPLEGVRTLTATVGQKDYRLLMAAPDESGEMLAESNDPSLRIRLSAAAARTLSGDAVAVPDAPATPPGP